MFDFGFQSVLGREWKEVSFGCSALRGHSLVKSSVAKTTCEKHHDLAQAELEN